AGRAVSHQYLFPDLLGVAPGAPFEDAVPRRELERLGERGSHAPPMAWGGWSFRPSLIIGGNPEMNWEKPGPERRLYPHIPAEWLQWRSLLLRSRAETQASGRLTGMDHCGGEPFLEQLRSPRDRRGKPYVLAGISGSAIKSANRADGKAS